MSLKTRLYRLWNQKRTKNLSATKIIAISFAVIVLLGTVLLMLPAASRSGVSCGIRPALFTATSATCVTGLVLYDTWSQWSGFGQVVILCLIEIGGLGFMYAASLFIFLFRRKIGLKQRMIMAQSMSLDSMEGVVRLQKWVLCCSLLIESIGAVILTMRFLLDYDWWTALRWGVFHSISAFCNAGFDIFGVLSPGASLIPMNNDPVILLTLSALIIVGGLGFFAWEEVYRVRKFRKFSVYTKLVLLMTGGLLIGGTACFCLLEWNNPATLGGMSVPQKLLNGFFQSVTVRTAGFAGVDQAGLTDPGKAVAIVLMMIGGSSGSTAGGVKTVTMLVLILFVTARARGKQTVCVFHRTIPANKVLDAVVITAIVVVLAMFGGIFISATSAMSFMDGLFESISALATVGLTSGGTGNLSVPAQLLIIIYMYFGRVGVLTISLGFLMGKRAEERIQYAQTNLLIG